MQTRWCGRGGCALTLGRQCARSLLGLQPQPRPRQEHGPGYSLRGQAQVVKRVLLGSGGLGPGCPQGLGASRHREGTSGGRGQPAAGGGAVAHTHVLIHLGRLMDAEIRGWGTSEADPTSTQLESWSCVESDEQRNETEGAGYTGRHIPGTPPGGRQPAPPMTAGRRVQLSMAAGGTTAHSREARPNAQHSPGDAPKDRHS